MFARFILLTLYLTFSIEISLGQESKQATSVYPTFSLNELDPFAPGQKLINIPKKFGTGESVEILKTLKIKKFKLVHDAYFFPIWVQYFNGTIIDFYTRLPSYFLHDTFHQSLINRYGKQQQYALKDSTAVYTWENKSIKRIYSGGCTITCYPIYYTGINKNIGQLPTTYKPLAEHFLNTGF
jgi:hypothetical protein